MDDNQDLNAGNGVPEDNSETDLGNQSAEDNSANSGNDDSANQDNQTTDTRDAELAKMQREIKRLNRALARNSRTPSQQNNSAGDDFDPDSPEGQYSTAMRLATGQLREQLEDVFDDFPELDPGIARQIRRNPWAFVNAKTFYNGDVNGAINEIASQIEEHIASQETQDSGVENQPAPNPGVTVNNNAVDTAGETEEEQVSDWELPMSELEKKVKRVKNTTSK